MVDPIRANNELWDLRIESLLEHPRLAWSADFLVPDPDPRRAGGWRLPADAGGELPLMFWLRATKPG